MEDSENAPRLDVGYLVESVRRTAKSPQLAGAPLGAYRGSVATTDWFPVTRVLR